MSMIKFNNQSKDEQKYNTSCIVPADQNYLTYNFNSHVLMTL